MIRNIFFTIFLITAIGVQGQSLYLGVTSAVNLQYSQYFEPALGSVRFPFEPVASYGLISGVKFKNNSYLEVMGSYNRYTLISLIEGAPLFSHNQGFGRKIESGNGYQIICHYDHSFIKKKKWETNLKLGIGINKFVGTSGKGFFVDSLEYKNIGGSDYWVYYHYFLTRYVNPSVNVFIEMGGNLRYNLSNKFSISTEVSQQMGFNALIANHILYDVLQNSLQNIPLRVYGVSQSMGNATTLRISLLYHFQTFRQKKK